MRYTFTKVVHNAGSVRVRRGVRNSDQLPVVAKSLDPDLADEALLRDRLQYEYEIMTLLAEREVPHIIRPIEVWEDQGLPHLVMQDCGGLALRNLMPLSIAETLHVATCVCTALMGVHAQGITHKNLTPNQIIFHRPSGVVEVADFDLAARLAREAQSPDTGIEGALPYVSPEQTGRMTRMLDHRSDFYTFGITLYQLLCGTLPFPQTDPLQLVHAHLALNPAHPCAIMPQLPRALGDLVMKLLEKAPEDRYQSARGLLFDLRAMQQGTPGPDFVLGSQDRDYTFQVPDKIYGRAGERALVQQLFASLAEGGRAMLMVSGPSGSGKTALIQSVLGALLARRGTFALGKHEEARRHEPLSGLLSAIDKVTRRALLEPPQALSVWQSHLQAALGDAGQVLTALCPALELLVGPQPAAPKLSPQQTENRLMFLLDRLLRACCMDEPLVLFLDDLQWADVATLKFLGRWRDERKGGAGLLLVGAFRSEEAPHDHPLRAMLRALDAAGTTVPHIELPPMRREDIAALLRDATHNPQVGALATLLRHKTGGNALFVREFVRDLATSQAIVFDPERRYWTWGNEALAQTAATDSVQFFMAGRIRALAHDVDRRLLSTAAVIGRTFSLWTLGKVLGTGPRETLQALNPALDAGFVAAEGRDWCYSEQAGTDVIFFFVHDKVHEAARSLLTGDALLHAHIAIGEAMLASLRDDSASQQLFSAVEHLNEARYLLDSAAQCDLAALNQRVAEEAQRAAAPDIAADYWARAVALWEAHNDSRQRYALLQQADCEFLTGRGAQAEARLQAMLANSQGRQEQVAIHRIRAKCFDAMGDPKQSVQASLAALRLLGLELPERPTKVHRIWAFVRMRAALGVRRVESLSDAPPIGDPRLLTLLDVLHDAMPPVYFGMPALYPLMLLTTAKLGIEHGRYSHSAFVYAAVGAIHAVMGDYATAKRYIDVARRCMQQDNRLDGAATLAVMSALGYASLPVSETSRHYAAASMACLTAGDIINATNSMGLAFTVLLLSDRQALAEELQSNSVNTQLHRDFRVYRRYYRQAERCMRGLTEAPGALGDADFEEASEVRRIDAGELGSACRINFYKLRTFMATLHGDWAHAVASGFQGVRVGMLTGASEHNSLLHDTFFAVALAERAHQTGDLPAPSRQQLRRIGKRTRCLAAAEPFLGLPISQWVEALSRSLRHKEVNTTTALFDAAARGLEPTGYIVLVGMARECAARHLMRHAQVAPAREQLRMASALYAACGALAQQRKLDAELADESAEAVAMASG